MEHAKVDMETLRDYAMKHSQLVADTSRMNVPNVKLASCYQVDVHTFEIYFHLHL